MGKIMWWPSDEGGGGTWGVDGPFLNPKGVPIRDPEVVCGRPSVRYCAPRSDALEIRNEQKEVSGTTGKSGG